MNDITDFLINENVNPSEKIPTKDGLYIRLYDLLDRHKKQLNIPVVSKRKLPLWVRPLIAIITMSLVTLYVIYKVFYVC